MSSNGTSQTPLRGIRVAVDGRYIRRPGMGIYNYLLNGVRAIVAAGAEVSLLVNFDPEPHRNVLPEARLVGLKGGSRNIVWEQVHLPRYLREDRQDVYWAPGNSGVGLATPRPTVLTVHDMVPLRFPITYILRRPGFGLPYLAWTLSGLIRADIVVTVSESSARDIRRCSGRRARVVSPVLTEAMVPRLSRVLEDWPGSLVPPGTKYLLYSGGLDPRKHVPDLLAAFAEAHRRDPQLRLVLMGRGYESVRGLLMRHRIQDATITTGYVTEGDKWRLLAHAHGLVYLSSFEGFGLPLVEAFAVGTPVITHQNSSLAEIAGEAALYPASTSASDVADAVGLLNDESIRRRLNASGRERLDAYEPQVQVQRLVGVFLELVSRRPSEAASKSLVAS